MDTDDDAADFLLGAEPLAAFLTTLLGQHVTVNQTYHWHKQKLIPTGKFGDQIVASKDELRRHFARLASGRRRVVL